MKPDPSFSGGFNLGEINATGQVPQIAGNWGLIDVDTPPEARTKEDLLTGQTWQLVFSDEFNLDGRTFYPGDDPYWEAVDLHYWQTGNLEWYDPKAIVTRNGSVEITLSKTPNHGLDYTGGMMSTWNKFCFTGGLVEVSVSLPGFNNVHGLWPAVWTMGNLGRAGYGASLEGMVCAQLGWTTEPLFSCPRSGHTPTTPVMLGPSRTRRSMVFLSMQRSTAIRAMVVYCPSFRARGSPVAHARGSLTLDLSTQTANTSAARRLRLIFLKPRCAIQWPTMPLSTADNACVCRFRSPVSTLGILVLFLSLVNGVYVIAPHRRNRPR